MALLRSVPRTDVAVAGVLALYGLGEALALGSPPVWMLWSQAVTLPLAFRRRWPVAVIGWVMLACFLPPPLSYHPYDSALPLPLIIVSAYTAGRETASGRSAVAGAVAVAAIAGAGALFTSGENSAGTDVVAMLVLVGGGAGIGHLMRVRSEENRRLQELTAQLEAERDLRARAAVAEERTRIARELHDVVAHSISLIAVQAAAAEELMGRDQARARSSLHAVRDAASGALSEMRDLLTVLRGDDGYEREAALAPQPGLATVGELVDRTRASGLPVSLVEEGTRPSLSAGVDLAAFRIVQEALTNVRKHAGAVPTEVRVTYRPETVELEIASDHADPAEARTDSAADGGGMGLTGMRERARIYGGTVAADPRDGRFVVHARLPIREPV